jgi:hypothetical protein
MYVKRNRAKIRKIVYMGQKEIGREENKESRTQRNRRGGRMGEGNTAGERGWWSVPKDNGTPKPGPPIPLFLSGLVFDPSYPAIPFKLT